MLSYRPPAQPAITHAHWIQAAKTMLLEYIEQTWRHSDNERRLMSDCANMVDKTFTSSQKLFNQYQTAGISDSY